MERGGFVGWLVVAYGLHGWKRWWSECSPDLSWCTEPGDHYTSGMAACDVMKDLMNVW